MLSVLIEEEQKELATKLRLHHVDGISWQAGEIIFSCYQSELVI